MCIVFIFELQLEILSSYLIIIFGNHLLIKVIKRSFSYYFTELKGPLVRTEFNTIDIYVCAGEEQHILDWSGHSHHLSVVKFVSKTKLVGHCMY